MWKFLFRPLFFILPAETAHHLIMKLMAVVMSFGPARKLARELFEYHSERLSTSIAGVAIDNPIGLAAGFDKDGKWMEALSTLGFGFLEMGTITGFPQPGNPRPRLFRLKRDQALINRMGFNNDGCEAAAARLAQTQVSYPLGINIGKSKRVPNDEAVDDYLKSFNLLAEQADYVVVNISSPNTPGLRELQRREPLTRLLQSLVSANQHLNTGPKPLFIKLAPDLHHDAVEEAVDIAMDFEIAGIIATNTTNSREGLETADQRINEIGAGGLSGAPLTRRSRQFVSSVFKQTRGELPIIGVGGIMTPEDAWQMICHGASAIQVYTGFVYGGPAFVSKCLRYIDRQLEMRGMDTISDAVGVAVDQTKPSAGEMGDISANAGTESVLSRDA